VKADLLQRWVSLWQRLGLAGDARPIGERILAGYSEPGRAYHNTRHLADCLAELDTVADLLEAPHRVELALWFHDLVCDPRRHDNEERSAELGEEWLRPAGVQPDARERVTQLILATKHTNPPADPDTQMLVDIDLGVLGQPPESYALYEQRIREEYAWVPKPDYIKGRGSVLNSFLNREAIYCTPHFRAKYEMQARANLRWALTRLAAPDFA
jgi:predicted metal-dependent HD superfamily phosphohydrolase